MNIFLQIALYIALLIALALRTITPSKARKMRYHAIALDIGSQLRGETTDGN